MKKLLFYLLIATFPLGVLTRLTVLPSVNIYFEDIIIMLILFFCWKDIMLFLKKRNSFVILFSLFALIGVIGVVGNVRGLFEIGSSLSYLGRLTAYLLIIIPLVKFPKNILNKLKMEMIVSGFIFVLFGYVQYLYYPALRNLYYLGWDEHLYRLFSTFLDPNFAGAFIVLIILLYSSFFFKQFLKLNIKSRIIYVLGYFFLFPSLLLTYSRSSYIVAIFSLTLFLVLLKQKKILLILGAVFVIGIFLLPKGLGGEGIKLFRISSIISRSAEYERALTITFNNPIIGVGFNSLRFVSGRYGFIPQKDLLLTHAGAGVPNSYLFVLVTTGVVGFILAMAFLFKVLKGVYIRIAGSNKNTHFFSNTHLNLRNSSLKTGEVDRTLRENRGNSMFAAAVFSSLIGILIGSFFENFLFYPQIMLWLIIIAGILFGSNNSTSRTKK